MKLVVDCDYTVLQPGYTHWARIVYGLSNKINPDFTERFIKYGESLFGGALAYLVIALIQRIKPFQGSPSPIVYPSTLAEVKPLFESIGVYSLRPKRFTEKDLDELGLLSVVDVIIGPTNVGLHSFLKPKSIRRESIVRCMEELGAVPLSTILSSDNPEDYKIAHELGISEIWRVATGPHKNGNGRYNPHKVFNSLQEALLQVNGNSYLE